MADFEDILISKEITINSSPKELFQNWRNFENLPQILDFLENVSVLDNTHSQWTAKLNSDLEEKETWNVEITNEINNHLIEWRSEGNADIFHEGAVRFSPTQNSTHLELSIRFFFPPLDDFHPQMLGKGLTNRIEQDLRRFKLAVEAGEFPRPRDNRGNLPK